MTDSYTDTSGSSLTDIYTHTSVSSSSALDAQFSTQCWTASRVSLPHILLRLTHLSWSLLYVNLQGAAPTIAAAAATATAAAATPRCAPYSVACCTRYVFVLIVPHLTYSTILIDGR